MVNENKISLIVPIHNGGKYISRLYRNIKRQSVQNIEIIFVENFSEDNSMEQLQKLQKMIIV